MKNILMITLLVSMSLSCGNKFNKIRAAKNKGGPAAAFAIGAINGVKKAKAEEAKKKAEEAEKKAKEEAAKKAKEEAAKKAKEEAAKNK